MEAAHQSARRRLKSLWFNFNAPLIIGSLLITGLLACAGAAPWLAPHDPLKVLLAHPDQPTLTPPFPPGTLGFPLGSDRAGRDLLSRLLYGSRYTLLLCGIATLVRLSIGTVVGMIAGWYDNLRRGVTILLGVWSALPSLFLASMLIPVIERGAVRGSSLVAFGIALCVTDWTGLAVRCQMAVRSLRAAPFIEAAYAIGQHRRAILWHHVLPNLRGLLLGEAASIMAASLLLVAELGFLSFFVGGAQESLFGGKYPDPVYAEWGSMLGKGIRDRNAGI